MNNVERTLINLIFGVSVLIPILFTIFIDVVTITYSLPIGIICLGSIWVMLWYGGLLKGYWDFLKHDVVQNDVKITAVDLVPKDKLKDD